MSSASTTVPTTVRRGCRRVTIPIFGFICTASEARFAERVLRRTPGVVHATVNPATEMAYVEFDACACDAAALKAAIKRAGLRAGPLSFR